MNYWLDLLQVQGEIKRKWRRWHLQRYMSSDTKYQHPSIGSSNNFSTQITMLTRCSPKTHRGSSSCHDDLSSIWVRAAATSMKLAERDVQNIRRKKTEDKNKKTKKKKHSVHLHKHCWRMTWSQLLLSTQGVAPLKNHYSFMIQRTCTGGSLHHYCRCGRCLSCCVDVRRCAVSRVNGVRWAIQMWKCAIGPAKWCNYTLIKNHSVDFLWLQTSEAAN